MNVACVLVLVILNKRDFQQVKIPYWYLKARQLRDAIGKSPAQHRRDCKKRTERWYRKPRPTPQPPSLKPPKRSFSDLVGTEPVRTRKIRKLKSSAQKSKKRSRSSNNKKSTKLTHKKVCLSADPSPEQPPQPSSMPKNQKRTRSSSGQSVVPSPSSKPGKKNRTRSSSGPSSGLSSGQGVVQPTFLKTKKKNRSRTPKRSEPPARSIRDTTDHKKVIVSIRADMKATNIDIQALEESLRETGLPKTKRMSRAELLCEIETLKAVIDQLEKNKVLRSTR